MEIDKEYELNVLLRIFETIKYKIIGDSASEVARSPITTDLFNRAIADFAPFVEKGGGVLKYGYIEDNPENLNAVKYHLSDIETWGTLDTELRRSIIFNIVCPYQIREETLTELTTSDTFEIEGLSRNEYWKPTSKEVDILDFFDDFKQAIVEKDADAITEVLKNVERDEESIKTILNNLGLI